MSVLLGQLRSHVSLPAVDLVLDDLGGTAAASGSTTQITSVQGKVSDWFFKIAGLTGETVDVTAVLNDAVAVTAAQLVVVDLSTGNDVSGAALGNGSYSIRLRQYPQIAKLTFTKSNTVEAVRIACCIAVDKPSAL